MDASNKLLKVRESNISGDVNVTLFRICVESWYSLFISLMNDISKPAGQHNTITRIS